MASRISRIQRRVEYGRGRLARKVRKLCGKSPEIVATLILADLDAFKSDAPTHDDQTLVVLKVR